MYVLEINGHGRVFLRLVLLVPEKALYRLGLEGGVVFLEGQLVQRGPGPSRERSGGGIGQQVHVFPVGGEYRVLLHGGGVGEIPKASILEVVKENVRLEHVHGVECQPVAVMREGDVVSLVGPEFGLGQFDGGSGLDVVQHDSMAAVDEREFLALLVNGQALGIVLREEYRHFSGAAVCGDAVQVGPAFVRPCVIDGLAVIAPFDFVYAFVCRSVKPLKELALGVGDVESAADDEGELLPVGRYVRGARSLSGEGPPDLHAAGCNADLRDRDLARGRLQDVDFIILQEYDGGASEGYRGVLDGLVE